jgi:hypothetical protein
MPVALCSGGIYGLSRLSDNYSREAMGFSAFFKTCETFRKADPSGVKGFSRGWSSPQANETRGKKGKYHPAPKRAEDGLFFAGVVNKNGEFSDTLGLSAG